MSFQGTCSLSDSEGNSGTIEFGDQFQVTGTVVGNEVSGTWLGSIEIDGEEKWKIGEVTPVLHTPIDKPLPSDC